MNVFGSRSNRRSRGSRRWRYVLSVLGLSLLLAVPVPGSANLTEELQEHRVAQGERRTGTCCLATFIELIRLQRSKDVPHSVRGLPRPTAADAHTRSTASLLTARDLSAGWVLPLRL
jgi:hypothetical protein